MELASTSSLNAVKLEPSQARTVTAFQTPFNADQWAEVLVQTVFSVPESKAVDLIYRTFDEWMRSDQISLCEHALLKVATKINDCVEHPVVGLAFLTRTHKRKELSARYKFAQLFEAELTRRSGEARAESLLVGLK